MTPEIPDKRDKLANLAVSPDIVNRLFFAARNLAIDSMCKGLEVKLLRQGFDAHVRWHESSFSGPRLTLSLPNPKPSEDSWEEGSCTVQVKREQIKAPDCLSTCYYSLESFSPTEYWRGKQPAKLLAFREAVSALHAHGELAQGIAGLNYPFDYPSHSSF